VLYIDYAYEGVRQNNEKVEGNAQNNKDTVAGEGLIGEVQGNKGPAKEMGLGVPEDEYVDLPIDTARVKALSITAEINAYYKKKEIVMRAMTDDNDTLLFLDMKGWEKLLGKKSK